MLRWMDQFINFLLWMDDGWMDGSVDLLNFLITACCLFQRMNGSLIGQLID